MKNIVILPLIVVLSACSSLNDFLINDNEVVIEEKGSGEIDAIEVENASFDWYNNQTPEDSNISTILKEEALKPAVSAGQRILYFEHNASVMEMRDNLEIVKHINFMRANPDARLRLEGHTDQRGSREYNLSLGESRALAVKEAMGPAFTNRIEVISYGEERPISDDPDKNRRVEFIYK